jgi:hypothetical protein
MEWSAITWRSASPSQQEPEHRWHGGEAVQLVFSWTLPQALPEASSGVSPSQHGMARRPRYCRLELERWQMVPLPRCVQGTYRGILEQGWEVGTARTNANLLYLH